MKNTSEQLSQGQTKKCPECQENIQLGAKKCKHCGADLHNWFMKHKIITVILIFLGIGMIGSALEGNETKNPSRNLSNTNSTNKTQDVGTTPDILVETNDQSKDVSVPTEYKSALKKATTYANSMHMSKRAVYDQLVSEYGEKFTPVAAQYAIDNVQSDWNENALSKAKTYQNTMNMSPAAIRDQLISEYGEKFTQSEADYAIEHLND